MKDIFVRSGLAFGLVFGCNAAPAVAAPAISITKPSPDTIVYRIDRPTVDAPSTSYPSIAFATGDLVRVSAGGCVQTGGHGATWKHYVDPDSSTLYHGLITLPGHPTSRLASMVGRIFTIPNNPNPRSLFLGYEDDGYADNGYTAHDNGTGNQCANSVNAWVLIVIEHASPILRASYRAISQTPGVNGIPILTADFHNPGHDTTSAAWPANTCSNQRWLANDPPKFEWTSVYDPAAEFDGDALGISGLAVDPPSVAATGGVSGEDVPFTHPFGGVDWETFIAPDPAYTSFLSGSNTGRPPGGNTANDNGEYIAANTRASTLGLTVPGGVQGMETDEDLIPLAYRSRDGDRVAVLGRWIVDCGHEDFHTEIHPPLLFVRGQAIPAGSNPDAPFAGTKSVTYSRLIGRPFLVGQDFGDGTLRAHLIAEVKKAAEFRSNRIEAHPKVYTTPFSGIHLFSYVVRAPVLAPAFVTAQGFPNRTVALVCRFHFTVRTGVSVQVSPESADSVRVYVAMNALTYKPATLPYRSDFNVSFSTLKKQEPSEATDIDAFLTASVLLRGAFGANIDRGILTDRYLPPLPMSDRDGEVHLVPVSALPVRSSFSIDDSQPFPVYGWLSLQWRPSAAILPTRNLPVPVRVLR